MAETGRKMTATMRRIQPYRQCHKRRSGDAPMAKKPHSSRKFQGGQSPSADNCED
ncbi:hypothetical protein TorRG33x02_330600, partial [Trema orientale]